MCIVQLCVRNAFLSVKAGGNYSLSFVCAAHHAHLLLLAISFLPYNVLQRFLPAAIAPHASPAVLHCSACHGAGLVGEVDQLQSQVEAAQAAHAAAAAQLESKRERLRECDSEIRDLHKQLQAIQRSMEGMEVERKRKDNK